LVIGTMLLLVAINLVKVYGGSSPCTEFADFCCALERPSGAGDDRLGRCCSRGYLAASSVRLSVLFGLLGGTIIAALIGAMGFDGVLPGALLSVPTVFPFGTPKLI